MIGYFTFLQEIFFSEKDGKVRKLNEYAGEREMGHYQERRCVVAQLCRINMRCGKESCWFL